MQGQEGGAQYPRQDHPGCGLPASLSILWDACPIAQKRHARVCLVLTIPCLAAHWDALGLDLCNTTSQSSGGNFQASFRWSGNLFICSVGNDGSAEVGCWLAEILAAQWYLDLKPVNEDGLSMLALGVWVVFIYWGAGFPAESSRNEGKLL